MLGTDPAGRHHLLPQCLPGPEQADGGVPRCQASLCRVRLDRRPVDLDTPQDLGVLGLKPGGQAADASADLPVHLAARDRRLQLPRERRFTKLRRSAPTVVVHDRVTEHAVEPSDNRLLVAQGTSVFEGAPEGFLQEVLRRLPAPHTSFQEAEERPPILHQRVQRRHGQSLPPPAGLGSTPAASAAMAFTSVRHFHKR
jgi:hypothetical protein